jgi:hypothetical protein
MGTKMDYSEIMQDLPRLHRERDDALRSESWNKAVKLTIAISKIDSFLIEWLYRKNFGDASK